MPLKARLRGFEPHVPEDLQVTFSDDLPSDVVCAQCDNVSATLHRDPMGHGYCTSCMKMCRRNGHFECFTCRNTYTSSDLQIDQSPRTKLRMMKIVCPRATKGKPVHIPLYSLQDHLQSCSCDQVPQANEASHQQATVGDSLGEQGSSGSQNSLSGELAQHRQETLSEIRNLKSEIVELENALDQKESHIQLVTETMQSYKADVSTLNKELSQQKSDIQQLTETVKLHDSDMKYLQAELTQKESHIQLLMDTVESYRTDITDMFKTIQETVSMLNKETKIRLQKIEDVLEGMDNRIEAAHIQLQEESKQSDDAQEKCNNKILQLQAAFDNLLCQISPP